jgi:hypothetical protein
MIILRSPDRIESEIWRHAKASLFLAGGITNCRNWQLDMEVMLKDTPLLVINPRRDNWDMEDIDASRVQIEWEHYYLEQVEAISFWFSSETLQPITLFELGKYYNSNKPIFIGIDPDYARRFDVEVQTSFRKRNPIPIVYTLEDLAQQVKDWINAY